MTAIHSLVRLVPRSGTPVGGTVQYCVQILVPSDDEGWKNIGNVWVSTSSVFWMPDQRYKEMIPSIGLAYGEQITADDPVIRPYQFARYKISLLIKKIQSGELEKGKVLPDGLDWNEADEKPIFLSQ